MKQKVINRGLCTSHFTKKNRDKQNGNYGLNRIFSGLKTVIFVFWGTPKNSKMWVTEPYFAYFLPIFRNFLHEFEWYEEDFLGEIQHHQCAQKRE